MEYRAIIKMKIPFNVWSRERIKQGKKICTSRHKKYLYDDRVSWISPPLPWWFIREHLWQPEGANSPEELQQVIENIMKREVLDVEIFYVHFGEYKE